jgi:hypothetical protein
MSIIAEDARNINLLCLTYMLFNYRTLKIGLQGGAKSFVRNFDCPGGSKCETDGSTNFYESKLTYNSKSGIFSGTLKMNQCPQSKFGIRIDNGSPSMMGAQSTCGTQTFPDAGFNDPNVTYPAPLRGALGYSKYGVNIYGPYEAGFTAGQVCSLGTCSAG